MLYFLKKYDTKQAFSPSCRNWPICVPSKPQFGPVGHWVWDLETVTQDLGGGSSHLQWQLSSRGQFSGGMVEMVSRPSDGWIHCPRWLDGWLRMRDGWPEMVVTRLCPLMASMAINRLIGYQRRTDSNHSQSDALPRQCTCPEPFKCSLIDTRDLSL